MYKKILLLGIVVSLLMNGCAKPQPTYSYSNINLLSNPGFEDVSNGFFTNWETDGASIYTKYPHSGTKYLIGGIENKPLTHTYQTIDLLSKGYKQEDINSGRLRVNYGGYQSGWKKQRDSGQIGVIFSDKNKQTIEISKMEKFYGPHWVLKQTSVTIPKYTRYITYTFTAQRADKADNDGNLDDAFIYIGKKNL